jgi:hypothetical protein
MIATIDAALGFSSGAVAYIVTVVTVAVVVA